MRADRLVAIVLLLQARGQLTAGELAELLETSERTIRRDLDGLLMAGVPLYSQRGRNGGWALLGGHRLDLSGFTLEEAQALFLVAGSPAAAASGVEPGLRSALRKVFAALPESLRTHATAATQATVFDPLGWGRVAEDPPLLDQLRRAVLDRVQVDIDYAKSGAAPEARRIHPYGLIAKGGVWYLLAGTDRGRRTFRVSRMRAVRPTAAPVELPESFDLATEWASAQRDFLGALQVVRVEVEVAADSVLAFTSGLRGWASAEEVGGSSAEWRTLVAMVPSIHAAAVHVAPLGGAVRVKSPPELRDQVVAIAEGLLEANRPGG